MRTKLPKKVFFIQVNPILRTQQRCILQKKVDISKNELSCLVDSLRVFLKNLMNRANCLQIPLSKPRNEIVSTESKDNLFVPYCNDIIEHRNRQIHLSFRFQSNNSCVSFIKNFELHGNQFILPEIVIINHRKIQLLYKNRYYDANNREIIQSNYDV